MGVYFSDTGISQFECFGSGCKRSEVGANSIGNALRRFVGTLPSFCGWFWSAFGGGGRVAPKAVDPRPDISKVKEVPKSCFGLDGFLLALLKFGPLPPLKPSRNQPKLPKRGPETPLDRRGSSCSACCTQNQPPEGNSKAIPKWFFDQVVFWRLGAPRPTKTTYFPLTFA